MLTFSYMKRYLCGRQATYPDILVCPHNRDIISLVKCDLCGQILIGTGTYVDE